MMRKAHLAYTDFCGGDQASKDGGLALLCYLSGEDKEYPDQQEDPGCQTVRAALRTGTGVVKVCSMGRLFDAFSALLGCGRINTYEGECASALELAAWKAADGGKAPYPLHFFTEQDSEGWTASGGKIILAARAALRDKRAESEELALGFHHAVSELTEQFCLMIRRETGEKQVALSGGVFVNRLISALCRERLENAGFTVYENEQVPCNDGGLALGQAYLAAFMIKDREELTCV